MTHHHPAHAHPGTAPRANRALRSAVLLALAACAGSAFAATAALPDPGLIPLPQHLALRDATLPLRSATLGASRPAERAAAEHFRTLVQGKAAAGAPVLPLAATPASATIRFVLAPKARGGAEGYSLEVDATRATVTAPTSAGLFNGATTLWQLVQPDGSLRAASIQDAPRFGWRGLMLDSARHFQSVDEIKQLLDAMAMHKLNRFHWHLTDDQGWRVPIDKYPKLIEVGACRIPAGDGGIEPATGAPRPYCGFYTKAEVRDIVAYATARHIMVIPEFDLPGHAQAAVAAYPALGMPGSPSIVSTDWGVHDVLFNPDEATMRFLEDVLAELIPLFPGPYFHLGGDEAVKDRWKASPAVQARIRSLGLANEEEMQAYMLKRLGTYLQKHGRKLIGWDEILDGGLPPSATVMSWRGLEGGVAAARQGHDVVMVPSSDLYFDYQQTHSADEPPGRPAIIDLAQAYRFEPIPAALVPAERGHILGLQANVWTEHMRSFARVEHAFFPRVAAVAETGWSPAASKDYTSFLARLPTELRRYQAQGIAFAQTPFKVQVDAAPLPPARPKAKVKAATITLSSPVGYAVQYWTGNDPAQAKPYTQPFEVALPAEIHAQADSADGILATLVPPTVQRVDATSLLARNDEALSMCSSGLMLRLEDDGPIDGPRAIYNVDIFNPCWLWKAAPLATTRSVVVRAGRVPYYFQLHGDEKNRRFEPIRTAYGELDVLAGCDGPRIATVPMPAKPDADGFVTLEAKLPRGQADADLCLRFTGDTRPTMWAIDRVTLAPR